jgi:AcrR family transcriptional regulator
MPDAAPRKKAPRRTAQRIQGVALDLFNRRGEPHVSTQMLAAELSISPGNLHYHYPTKAELVNALYDHFEGEHTSLLRAATNDTPALLDWLRDLQMLAWDYRFLFRDLSDLLTRNHHVETRLPAALQQQEGMLAARLTALSGPLGLPHERLAGVVTALMLVLSHWIGFEYLRDPRHALENDRGDAVAQRALAQMKSLLGLPV